MNDFSLKKGTDVTFKVMHEEFAAHRSILMARSPVFNAMFKDEMKEYSAVVVHILGYSPETFKDFLIYIYSKKFRNISNIVHEVYRLAEMYDVDGLKSACVFYMMTHLSLENVCEAAAVAYQFDEKDLKFKTQKFFNRNYCDIFVTKNWMTLLQHNNSVACDLLKIMAGSVSFKNDCR